MLSSYYVGCIFCRCFQRQKVCILSRAHHIFCRSCLMLQLSGPQNLLSLFCYCTACTVLSASNVIKTSCLDLNILISYKGWKRRMWIPRSKRGKSKYSFYFNCCTLKNTGPICKKACTDYCKNWTSFNSLVLDIYLL